MFLSSLVSEFIFNLPFYTVSLLCDWVKVVKPFIQMATNGVISSKKLRDAITALLEGGQHSKFKVLSLLSSKVF